MAKESSFDVVSVVDIQELDNAFQQAKKEIVQRYDLKNSDSELDFDKSKLVFSVSAPSDFVCSQVIDVLSSKLIRRGIELNALKWGAPIPASGGKVKKIGNVINGIDKDTASVIAKDIRAGHPKVKPLIEGDKVRVVSPSIDALQAVIASLKEKDYGQPLQYINYR